MPARYGIWSAAALSLAALGAVAIPQGACAQDVKDAAGKSTTDLREQPIDLDLESANLYDALTLLFTNAKANYLLDPAVKQSVVTAHFHQVPLRVALDILLKSSGKSLTYRYENSIFSVVPKVETPAEPPLVTPAPDVTDKFASNHRVYKIRSEELVSNAIDIVTWLGGTILNSQAPAGLTGFGSGGLGGLGNGAFGNGQGGFGGGQQGGGIGGGLGGFGGGGIGSPGGGVGGINGSGSGAGGGQSGFSSGVGGFGGGSLGGGGQAGGGTAGRGIASGLLPAGISSSQIYALAADNSIIIDLGGDP